MKTIADLRKEGILNDRIKERLSKLTDSNNLNKACIHLLVKMNLARKNFEKYKRKHPEFKNDLAYILNNLDYFKKSDFKFKVAGKNKREDIKKALYKPVRPKRKKKRIIKTPPTNLYSLYARVTSVPM